MASDPQRACRMSLVDAGLAGRTPLVLRREAGLWAQHASRVRSALQTPARDPLSTGGEPVRTATTISTAAPNEPEAPITIVQLEALLAAADPVDAVGAAFLAGRCSTDDPADLDGVRARLASISDAYDPTSPSEMSLLAAECGFSLALLGEPETARAALRPMVSVLGPRSTNDWLAAYYLAQLGDVCGYPLIVRLLGHELGHYRILAMRHLAGFLPHDGEHVDGDVIDVVGRLSDRLDDDDPDVGVEVPGLLAEAGGEAVRPILERASEKARRSETRKAASWVLERLAGG